MIFAKIHPLLVHFPVALFVSGVLLILYGKLQKEETVQVAGLFNIRFGFWCALVTLSVGILAVINMEVKDKFREMLGIMQNVSQAKPGEKGVVLRLRSKIVGRHFRGSHPAQSAGPQQQRDGRCGLRDLQSGQPNGGAIGFGIIGESEGPDR